MIIIENGALVSNLEKVIEFRGGDGARNGEWEVGAGFSRNNTNPDSEYRNYEWQGKDVFEIDLNELSLSDDSEPETFSLSPDFAYAAANGIPNVLAITTKRGTSFASGDLGIVQTSPEEGFNTQYYFINPANVETNYSFVIDGISSFYPESNRPIRSFYGVTIDVGQVGFETVADAGVVPEQTLYAGEQVRFAGVSYFGGTDGFRANAVSSLTFDDYYFYEVHGEEFGLTNVEQAWDKFVELATTRNSSVDEVDGLIGFDAEAYGVANPWIQTWVDQGKFASLTQHFIAFGRFGTHLLQGAGGGNTGAMSQVDYLTNNPDVDLAIAQGQQFNGTTLKSAWWHGVVQGQREGRISFGPEVNFKLYEELYSEAIMESGLTPQQHYYQIGRFAEEGTTVIGFDSAASVLM